MPLSDVPNSAAWLDSLSAYSIVSHLRNIVKLCFFSPLFDMAEPCEVDIVKRRTDLKLL